MGHRRFGATSRACGPKPAARCHRHPSGGRTGSRPTVYRTSRVCPCPSPCRTPFWLCQGKGRQRGAEVERGFGGGFPRVVGYACHAFPVRRRAACSEGHGCDRTDDDRIVSDGGRKDHAPGQTAPRMPACKPRKGGASLDIPGRFLVAMGVVFRHWTGVQGRLVTVWRVTGQAKPPGDTAAETGPCQEHLPGQRMKHPLRRVEPRCLHLPAPLGERAQGIKGTAPTGGKTVQSRDGSTIRSRAPGRGGGRLCVSLQAADL